MRTAKGPNDPNRTQNEAAARAALEMRLGRAITDPEWAAARRRLLEFISILRGWDQQTRLANVGDYAGENHTQFET